MNNSTGNEGLSDRDALKEEPLPTGTSKGDAPEAYSRPPNAFKGASLVSRLVYYWAYPLMKLGMERPLVEKDVPEILPVDSSKYNREHLGNIWDRERQRSARNNKRPSLHRAILVEYFWSTLSLQPIMCIGYVAKIIQAIYLGNLIESFDGGSDDGYQYAVVIVACGFVILIENHHSFFVKWRKGMQLRLACVAAIYEKTLKLSSTHQETSASSGTIMNLASNDVERFILSALFITHVIWCPLQAIAILVVGWLMMGPAFAVGFCLLIFGFVPFQFYLSSRFAFLRSKIAAITDKRVQFVSQAVQGARVMKMSGYEDRFLERIADGRKAEISQINKANRLHAMNESMYFSCNIVISLVIFLVHVGWFGGALNPGMVYTVFTLVNILQVELTKHVSLGVMGCSEAYVSISRIQRFLEFPEKPQPAKTEGEKVVDDSYTEDTDVIVALSDVDCYWNFVEEQQGAAKSPATVERGSRSNDETSTITTATVSKDQDVGSATEDVGSADHSLEASLMPALSGVSLEFRKGQLTCVIGKVGCGKSALLQAIIGELPVYKGRITQRYNSNTDGGDKEQKNVRTREKIAYASQDPWIMNGTVFENITMGLPFDQEWYNRVIDACGLRMDLAIFQDGDKTLVGERGVQCSGGQRARIGLARAIYRDAEVLVADDPLSAVDAKVGKQIFNEALLGLCVKRGRCVVLATHQHQYIHDYECVLLESGRVKHIGSYYDCVEAAGGTLSLEKASEGSSSSDDESVAPRKSFALDETEQECEEDECHFEELADPNAKTTSNDGASKAKQEFEETQDTGDVKWDTLTNYVHAMGGWRVGIFIIFVFCFTQGIALWAIVTMGQWGKLPVQEQGSRNFMTLIIGQVILAVILATFRAFFSYARLVSASKKLHDEMAKAVLRAKIAFFDTNPMGRILNRFSADVGSNDDMLPDTIFDFAVFAFISLGAVLTTLVTLPFILLIMPPLIYKFILVRRMFVTSTQELKRIEGGARSPIFAMMNESLSGIATIRANETIQYFTKKFERVHDAHTRVFFAFIGCSRWVGFRMDSIVYLMMSCVCFLSVLFQAQGWFNVDPAILGMSISMLLQMCASFQWCIRQSAEIVNLMVSVERVLGYGKIEPEAPLKLESDKDLDESWPSKGAIDVKNVDVRYRTSLPLALDGASFSVPSGSRIGVVGRTGSGKSTIVQTLFRLLESERGQINIDGIDIANIGLHRLRTSISVIPQHPTLFSGSTVRENLDVFGLHSNEAIHEALKSAHLTEAIAELPKGIDTIVSEGGSNFSVGQRQLLCLARAILSKNKILILDEATASVDRRTDQMLHESLNESFGDATVIAVAHRLDTVIDHDFILVLGRGKVLEFGPPADLLKKSGGAFFTMVQDTGETTANELKERAFGTSQVANTE
mmetsp:Transcript_107829/g.220103  ORF Transcript_107829/g.220103 Transcript_107829/m.220103 type:complete len:1402 (+) Transcript_107829:151-4356(+)